MRWIHEHWTENNSREKKFLARIILSSLHTYLSSRQVYVELCSRSKDPFLCLHIKRMEGFWLWLIQSLSFSKCKRGWNFHILATGLVTQFEGNVYQKVKNPIVVWLGFFIDSYHSIIYSFKLGLISNRKTPARLSTQFIIRPVGVFEKSLQDAEENCFFL